jgi:hypothetical protein
MGRFVSDYKALIVLKARDWVKGIDHWFVGLILGLGLFRNGWFNGFPLGLSTP